MLVKKKKISKRELEVKKLTKLLWSLSDREKVVVKERTAEHAVAVNEVAEKFVFGLTRES